MPVCFRVLGPLEIDTGSMVAAVDAPKQAAVLSMLLLNRNRHVRRAVIVERVWGAAAPDTAEHAVEVYVSALRKLTDAGAVRGGYRVLTSTSSGYSLQAPDDAVDAAVFERLVSQSVQKLHDGELESARDAARQALELWRGAPLAALEDHEFAVAEAQRLEALRVMALECVASAELEMGGGPGLTHWLERAVQEAPVSENLTRLLMLAKRRSGDNAGAATAFYRARERLNSDLGLEPGPQLQRLLGEIVNQGLASPGSGPRTEARLPVTQTLFVGRDRDIDALASLVRDARLVTICGFPGVGKTRLALESVAAIDSDAFDNVAIVELSGLSVVDGVHGAVARALGLQEHARTIKEVLADYLSRHAVLVILDNCEHLLPGVGAAAGTLLAWGPSTRILATSVTPLGVDGEVTYPIESLGVPASASQRDLDASPAAAMLRDRLSRLDSAFDPGPEEREAMFRVCRSLDGLPLSIELAAARTRVLSLARLAEILDEDRELVSNVQARGPRGRRSLHAAVAASYGDLEPGAKRLLEAGAQFPGAIDIDLLLKVSGLKASRGTAVALVDGLAERALLARARLGGQPRLRMLQAVRDFVAETIPPGRRAGLQRRFVETFASLCERLAADPEGPGQVSALETLEQELDSVRIALRSLIDAGEAARALHICGALGRFWWARGHLTEGRAWLRELLAAVPTPSLDRAEAIRILAYMEWSLGDPGSALVHSAEALGMAQQLGDQASLARSHYYHGIPNQDFGSLDEAKRSFRRGLQVARAIGDRHMEGLLLDMLGRSLTLSHLPAGALKTHVRALALLRETGDDFGIGVCLINLAEANAYSGDEGAARSSYGEAHRVFSALRCVVGIGYALQGLAWLAARQDRPGDAAALIAEMRANWELIGFAATPDDLRRNAEITAAAVGPGP